VTVALGAWKVVSHRPLDSRQQPQFCDATNFRGHTCHQPWNFQCKPCRYSSQYRAGHIFKSPTIPFLHVRSLLFRVPSDCWSGRTSNLRLSVLGEQLLLVTAYKNVFQSIALHVASAGTASGVGPSSPNAAVCQCCGLCLYHSVTPPAKSSAITGGTNADGTACGIPPGDFASNNSGATQPGIPPSVPCGMTVGASPSGVPPDVSASNDAGAAQAGVLPSVPGSMAVGATPSGVPPDVSASNDSGAAVWCTSQCSW
jgi:hypothetical protein